MNDWQKVVCVVTVLLVLAGCSTPAPTASQSSPAPGPARVSFINKVWRVSEPSDIAPGALYVFLSDGTLVMSSPNGKPAFGMWRDKGGALTMIEEGIPYKTDILKLSKDEFRIRSNNPGKPVEITLVSAEGATPPK